MDVKITEPWVPADDSGNHIELAKGETSDGTTVYGMRNTFQPTEVNYHTERQILGLARAVERGTFNRLGIRNS